MKAFWHSLMEPIFHKLEPSVVMEIGSFRGVTTRLLLEYCRSHQATLHAIDPLPQFDVDAWQAEYGGHFEFHRAKSLDVLPSIAPADIVLIDGDHNWYTVYHELQHLARSAEQHQRAFPVVLFHDIGWPYARRDLYYDPDDIPPAFRQPYQQNGIVQGQSALHPTGANGNRFNATTEGGRRNGVLTAVEDFIGERDDSLRLILIHGFHGLGILYPVSLKDVAPTLNTHFTNLAAGLELLGDHILAQDEQITDVRYRARRQKQRRARASAAAETK